MARSRAVTVDEVRSGRKSPYASTEEIVRKRGIGGSGSSRDAVTERGAGADRDGAKEDIDGRPRERICWTV